MTHTFTDVTVERLHVHPVHFLYHFILHRIDREPVAYPWDLGHKVGDTLKGVQATTAQKVIHTLIHTHYGQFKGANQSIIDVFKGQEVTGVPRGNHTALNEPPVTEVLRANPGFMSFILTCYSDIHFLSATLSFIPLSFPYLIFQALTEG